MRVHFFRTRSLGQSLSTPERFLINTPDTLVSYWSMFVERELRHRLWETSLKRAAAPVVIDVGANAGVFCLYVHSLNPATKLTCFEPLPQMVDRIEQLSRDAGMNLTCHPFAVSYTSGEALFESPLGAEGTSKFVEPASRSASSFKVKTITLDEALPNEPIDLIKIDVEGFECDVLRGGSRSLANTRFLIVEAQSDGHLQAITRLLGHGWTRIALGSSDYLFKSVS